MFSSATHLLTAEPDGESPIVPLVRGFYEEVTRKLFPCNFGLNGTRILSDWLISGI